MHGVNTYLQWNSIMPAEFWWLPTAAPYRIPMWCEKGCVLVCMCVFVCLCVCGRGWGCHMPETHSPKTSRWKQRETDNDMNCCDRCLNTPISPPSPPPPPPKWYAHTQTQTHTDTRCLFCVGAYYNNCWISYPVWFPVIFWFFSIKHPLFSPCAVFFLVSDDIPLHDKHTLIISTGT